MSVVSSVFGGSAGILLLASAGCFGSRMGQADARLDQGRPCFGVSPSESRGPDLQLQAIILYDTSTTPPTEVWSVGSEANAPLLPIPPPRCVRIDERPAGYRVESSSVPLERGRVYEVYVNAKPPTNRGNTMAYTQRFCLDGAEGAARIIPLPPNAATCSPPR
jgi:hypothetical protein